MTRLVHLSDLHFGLHREALVAPLLDRVNGCGADLVVVTGDLTHRGMPQQYDRAAAFLRTLALPWMAVPGNHDLPGYNLPARVLRPWRDWRRCVAEGTSPVRRIGATRIIGLDSVDRLAWQRGRLPAPLADAAAARIDPGLATVIALHHPMQHRPGVDKALMRGAAAALTRFEAAGAWIVLSGHLHRWSAGAFLGPQGRGLLQIQAGTALCARLSDGWNEFAVLDLRGPALTIERHVAGMDETRFRPPELLRFAREDGRWRPVETAAAS